MKKKILIIGKNSFIGNGLFNYLKKKFFVKKISFKNFDNNVNNYNYIINCSIDKNYITKKYNAKNDIDLKIIKKIKDKRIYYIFLSTRKVYKVGPNLNENSKISPVDNYGKNKLITENKIKKYFNNTIILRISNVIGLKKKNSKSHNTTYADIFFKLLRNGVVIDNNKEYKDFISIKNLSKIISKVITLKLKGIYNISNGKPVLLNKINKWLLHYKNNNKKFINRKLDRSQKNSFYLNNKKILKKTNIKVSELDLKKECLKISKFYFKKNKS